MLLYLTSSLIACRLSDNYHLHGSPCHNANLQRIISGTKCSSWWGGEILLLPPHAQYDHAREPYSCTPDRSYYMYILYI